MDDASQKDRFQIAAIVAAMASGIGGMGVAGWFGEAWRPGSAMIAAVIGALAGGFIEASGLRNRVFAAASFLIGGICLASATAWYVSGRTSIIKIELLVPFAIALVPFGVARWVFGKLTAEPSDSWSNRHIGVLVATVIFCAVVGASAYAPLATASADAENAEKYVKHSLTLDFTTDARLHYQGESLDEAQLRALLKGVADAEPSTHVVVRIPKGTDPRVAIAKVLPTAMQLGLQVESIDASAK